MQRCRDCRDVSWRATTPAAFPYRATAVAAHAALAADTFDLFNFAFQVVCNKMPFPTRPLQPTSLGRVPPPPGEDPLLWLSNHNLCQAMRQLVSLLKQADSLFADLEVR